MKDIRIVLVSDNHGADKPLEMIKSKYSSYDYKFHCGDSEMPEYMLEGFAAVAGNNDYYGSYPGHLVLHIGEHRFLLTHGHRDFHWGRMDMLAEAARAHNCDVVCFGHTHVPYDDTVKGIRLLNPGSLSHNRDGSDPSYMILTLHGSEIFADLKRIKVRHAHDEWF
jgi:putative phosphoesterase